MEELDERLAAEDTTPEDIVKTTTAAEGASIEEVKAGMKVREGGEGTKGYAQEGSLARELGERGEGEVKGSG